MRRLRFPAVALAALTVVLAGLSISLFNGTASWAGDYERYEPYQSYQSASEEPCTIMHPTPETLRRWVEAYNRAPRAYIDEDIQIPSPMGSLDLIDHLEYTPADRNQGSCGNCWAWAGTGVMEIAFDVQNGIKDRLSIQYLNSNYNGGSGSDWACCGGWLEDVADFYTSYPQAVPWSNTNAEWQDGGQTCGDEATTQPAGEIVTTPNYPIDSIQEQVITTQTVTQATAIANIKNVLDQNKAVWFAYFLPTGADWTNFRNFWNTGSETDIWDPDFSCGHTWDSGGGGHAVLCVGYNDEDGTANDYWIIVNSWGTAGGGRPNGIFRLATDMDYGCYFYDPWPQGYYSFYWQTLDITYDVWESYSSTAPLTWCDDFQSYQDEHTVYMYGTGFENNHSYWVAYYDGDDDNVATENETSDGSGNLESQHTFRETDPVDQPGTWHVIVCETAYDPPDTYNASWAYTIVEDTFAVQQSAIPEFPTALAAIAVLALCAGTYLWMRRKAAPVTA